MMFNADVFTAVLTKRALTAKIDLIKRLKSELNLPQDIIESIDEWGQTYIMAIKCLDNDLSEMLRVINENLD